MRWLSVWLSVRRRKSERVINSVNHIKAQLIGFSDYKSSQKPIAELWSWCRFVFNKQQKVQGRVVCLAECLLEKAKVCEKQKWLDGGREKISTLVSNEFFLSSVTKHFVAYTNDYFFRVMWFAFIFLVGSEEGGFAIASVCACRPNSKVWGKMGGGSNERPNPSI